MLSRLNPFIRHGKIQYYGARRDISVKCTQDYRIFFGMHGQFGLSVEDKRFEIMPGAFLLIPPQTPYSFIDKIERIKATHFAVFDFELTDKNSDIKQALAPYPHNSEPPHPHIEADRIPPFDKIMYFPVGEFAKKDIRSILNLFLVRDIYYREFSSLLLKRILLNSLIDLKKNDEGYSPLVSRAVDYIRRHFRQPLTNKEIGEALGYHPCYVSEQMKRETGRGIKEFLIFTRLDNSIRYLMQAENSISEVAAICGFPSASRFTELFHREYGITPKEYRKANKLLKSKS